MKTQKKYNTAADLVKVMRQIREEISNEIKDMTFEEEREYLNQLLNPKAKENSASGRSIDSNGMN